MAVETKEGILHVRRQIKFGTASLFEQIILQRADEQGRLKDSAYYKNRLVYMVIDAKPDDEHEPVYRIRGKAAETAPLVWNERRVRVTGALTYNQHTFRLGSFRRASIVLVCSDCRGSGEEWDIHQSYCNPPERDVYPCSTCNGRGVLAS